MKTAAQVANHPKAQLQREIVARLRESGSVKGAEQTWLRLQLNPRLWKRVIIFGLNSAERQLELNKIAFPDCNAVEVDAALMAGNRLGPIYELACGRASIARDGAGLYKVGRKGLIVIKHGIWRSPDQIKNAVASNERMSLPSRGTDLRR